MTDQPDKPAKPREWWILPDGQTLEFKPEHFRSDHVIEKSAYDAVVRERDEYREQLNTLQWCPRKDTDCGQYVAMPIEREDELRAQLQAVTTELKLQKILGPDELWIEERKELTARAEKAEAEVERLKHLDNPESNEIRAVVYRNERDRYRALCGRLADALKEIAFNPKVSSLSSISYEVPSMIAKKALAEFEQLTKEQS